ncbi:RagB/SusD family nutrient uptake outer membrane protein [Labilibaculum sp. K2S]|uniref:RagB/SusD family nutrient uptake outer membrane protein n=1 Tax=Labilibaculum sp. K2S TaxID=3056386 RepID=UPI0025A33949|nr:RagB/SusD family nutrient uptake outer membrane protein [Labilibaculum sp. K2S]MDM8158463.1 RagB/SusD family nutrient uptake outer membrane protein [Labilibaculum sp. K2S]
MRKYIINTLKCISVSTFSMTLLLLSSCDDFVDIGAPEMQVGVEEAFENEASATSAILGLYAELSTYDEYYVGCMECSADGVLPYTNGYGSFVSNAIPTNNYYTSYYLWGTTYNAILQANYAINGLNQSKMPSSSVKSQLLGEAKFWRAFSYFYLVNMFGDVPMPLGTDVIENASLPRTATSDVYDQIITDLTDAKELLGMDDPSLGDRVRVNQSGVSALLARVYLYQEDWVKAEAESGLVISNSAYELSALDETFVNSCKETILQIANTTGVSKFGEMYVPVSEQSMPSFYLTDNLFNSFSEDDLRKSMWIKQVTVNGQEFGTISKYKVKSGTGNEYDIVMRLAEQYLIRAEARAHLNRITGANSAETDLNTIRNRAGLENTDASTQSAMFLAIEKERNLEFFGEWGHRWLDLKRTPSIVDPTNKTRADDVLSESKPTWISTAILYPIPESQIKINTKLTQNPGYNN